MNQGHPAGLTILAPAKINLFLDILRRRSDGFHDLHTVFAAVNFADRVTLAGEVAKAPLPASPFALDSFTVSGPCASGVPADEANLVVKALRAFERHCSSFPPLRLSLHLEKQIPHGAGLGGGSSDAAAALRATNALLPEPLSIETLEAIAATVGSDCAFFVRGGVAEGTGRGEVLAPLAARRQLHVLLVLPDFAVNTREAYGLLRPEHLGLRSDVKGLKRWLAGEDIPFPNLHNSFEAALAMRHPELGLLREQLRSAGAFFSLLSGSGSATFGLFDSEAAARAAESEIGKSARCVYCVGGAG